ncbi:hypothetical protein GCM10010112_08110 [Actinoplanes lobatus]|uniref:Uncharacterized protein n=1 Tax=Actinoplanes lobatus TaxID=113568 RepID=A0A7W7HB57_9ACTN|nr:hypothetical protein [Actinoplanes lobatus]MBB4747233.1 hypothetical protein [Actinoplanes lobatus]GGN56345.1 hypothetical protein GCM10010112_08110 [Actinoplanes lobatus]GIE39201.1 hypothetical protein Alo02nite_20990 [Actinoplanes lobatus]
MTVTGEDSELGIDPLDPPLMAPLRRDLTWQQVQSMSQSVGHRDDPVLRRIRATAAIRRGTRMTKVLSAAQVAGHLGGWLPYGFCYRSCDIAHLREPDQLALLRTDGATDSQVTFALRWRATDPLDFEVPGAGPNSGLTALPAHSRIGAMVLGTGFTMSVDDLIPEYVTAGFADLPMPANAQLLAYVPGGDEVVLYTYQPEQHGWLRLAGPRWRSLLGEIPDGSPDREYVPCTATGSSRLVGSIDGKEYEAVADPPGEFRVRALTRAARYPVQTLSRRAEQALWRGASCWVLQRDETWARLRLLRPEVDEINTTGARCYERGVYEAWAPVDELTDHHIAETTYQM